MPAASGLRIFGKFPRRVYVITENPVVEKRQLAFDIVVKRYPYNVLSNL